MTLIAYATCSGYWLILTLGLLRAETGPADDTTAMFGFGDHPDLAHFLAFALLALVFHVARWPGNWRWHAATLIVYAVGTEFGQAWVPGRTANLIDSLANLIGLAAGTIVWKAGTAVASRDSSEVRLS